MRVKVITGSLFSIGDPIYERDHIDSILQGLLEEYNPFVMMIYSKPKYIYDVEALKCVQEAQLDMYKQEVASLSATANVAQVLINLEVTKHGISNDNSHHYFCCRGISTCGRGRIRKTYTTRDMLTCELCNKYDHYVLEYLRKFDENFELIHHKSQPEGLTDNNLTGTQFQGSRNSCSTSHNLLSTSEFSSNSSGPNNVVIGNGHILEVQIVGHSHFFSNLVSNYMLNLIGMLHMPSITRNLIYVTKLARDNNVYFEFHSNKCFIKSQASNVVLLGVFLDERGLYCFTNLALEPSRNYLSHKSQSLCLIVNHILASYVHNKVQFVNTIVNPNVLSI